MRGLVPAHMSLSLIQDYYSEEESEEGILDSDNDHSGFEDAREQAQSPPDDVHNSKGTHVCQGLDGAPTMASSSLLPSPDDLFSEVTGPPEFLKTSTTEPLYTRVRDNWQLSPGILSPVFSSDSVTNFGLGAVLETRATSSGSHEEGKAGADNGRASGRSSKGLQRESITSAPRLYTAADVKSSISDAEKRSRSKIKDKEKNKRMKGQSSHATWKSETEMHLRQQFD